MSLIETRNLFVNTEQTLIGECRNVGLNLPQYLLQCAENQRMRLTLNSFSMRKNWYSINKYNNTFFVVFKSNDVIPILNYSKVTIPQGNYQSFTDQTYGLAKAIETALDNVLKTQFLIVTPATAVAWDYVTNKFTVTFDTTGATSGNSTGGNNPSYTMTSFYNASLNSEEAIYLRTDLNSTSFQTSGFDSGSQLFPYIVNSQILAKIPLNNAISVFVQESGSSVTDEGAPVTSTSTADYRYERPYELIQYTDNGNNIYSIILVSKKVNSMRLFVTDSYGRLLPEISQQQINCDGMNFTASLRVDIFQD
jgi:hypothetical protein